MLRNLNPVALLSSLDRVEAMVEPVEEPFYLDYKRSALARLPRDPEDWPIAASALLLNCPIWTEDLDFFGCGIPTWTTANIEIYLREP
jgi:predicted nucleic acid-binding protein